MTVRRSRAVLVAALLGAAALSGCDNGGAPPQVLPPLPSASATATTGTTTAATPTDTASALKRSAEQFMRAYFAEYERAQRTNDYARLAEMYYAKGCSPCEKSLQVLAEDKRLGRHVEGYEAVIDKIDSSGLEGNTVAVDIVLRRNAGRLVNKDGMQVEALRATKPVASSTILAQTGTGSWRIINIISFGGVNQ